MINFHPITIEDKEQIQRIVFDSECRNCDLNIVNLMSWRFLYDTEVAFHNDWLLFRFKADGHNAYLAPTGHGEWAPIVKDLLDDAEHLGEPFLMLGCTQTSLNFLNDAMPDYFYANADRSYTDYLYLREKLAGLSGKKLQQKRNHTNRFRKEYPHYEYLPLTREFIPECIALDEAWNDSKADTEGRLSPEAETKSVKYVFDHWEELGAVGGVIRIDGKIIAFTYGGPVNYDTFDTCAEKANTDYNGAYAIINQEFARHLPEQYVYINREEDLGVAGLRKAKESYRPEMLLHKYTVMEKHPLGVPEAAEPAEETE